MNRCIWWFCSHVYESFQNVTNERNVNMKKICQFWKSQNNFSWNGKMNWQMKVYVVALSGIMSPLNERTMHQRYSTLNLNEMKK